MGVYSSIMGLFFGILVGCSWLSAQSPVSIIDTSQIIISDASNDYSYVGPHANASSPYNSNGVSYEVRFNRGAIQNIRINGFTHASSSYYTNAALNYFIKIKRVDSVLNIGDRQLLFYHRQGYNTGQRRLDLAPSFIGDMEETLSSSVINRGTDNVFGNAPSNNLNNIERIDVMFPEGIVTNQVSQVGILILERGGNDPFKVAAVTSLTSDSIPASYSTLVLVPVSAWGSTGINPEWVIMRKESPDSLYRIVENIGSQSISGVFLSFSDLGLVAGDTFFGYSIFGSDVDTLSHDLTDPTTFPLDTDNATGQAGGLDILSIPGVFHPDNVLLNTDCFESFTLQASSSSILLSWSVSSNDLNCFYVIEHSADGNHFMVVDSVMSRGGFQYNYVIEKSRRLKSYYRIRKVDLIGGKSCVTHCKKYENKEKNRINIAPLLNPFSSELPLEIQGMPGSQFDLLLINKAGRTIMSQSLELLDYRTTIRLPFEGYSAGMYYIVVQTTKGDRVSRVVIKN